MVHKRPHENHNAFEMPFHLRALLVFSRMTVYWWIEPTTHFLHGEGGAMTNRGHNLYSDFWAFLDSCFAPRLCWTHIMLLGYIGLMLCIMAHENKKWTHIGVTQNNVNNNGSFFPLSLVLNGSTFISFCFFHCGGTKWFFWLRMGEGEERETTCMHASYQARKGDCRVLDCPASKVLFTVGSSCLAHLNHKWPGSVFFFSFFFCSKFCHFLTKNLGVFGKKIYYKCDYIF
jgi:hypothetical protein